MSGHDLDPSILREYDIRGIVGETLDEGDARAIGRAFATEISRTGGGSVHVGRDGRVSSVALEAALVAGLTAGGMKVTRIGLGPTPMLYFSAHTGAADGGIMVTGSHNPPNHNGFKLVLGGRPFFGADIQRLGELASAGDFVRGAGSAEDADILEAYVERIAADYGGGAELAVGWDAGNGSAGPAMALLAGRLPGRHLTLFEEVDGLFPNHHPDPTMPENLVALQDLVAAEGLDMGIAFDGDGDRIGAIDGKGRILWGDQMLAILARGVLDNAPGATIIADVKASQVLFDEVARLGGVPLMWKTGHSLIKAKMAETKAPLAGEMSGHIFFADRYYGYDDALYAAVRLISVVASSGKSLAELRDELPNMFNTPELRFACGDGRKFAVVEEVAARLRVAGADMNDCDGVRVQTDDGWWLLRASNTQEVLVARCESESETGLERLKMALVAALEMSGVAPPEF
ncbi:MAG: phosphomannomutase/phosphoglucomutase [Alphaproteobacteria bacterium]|nr:phosphomannomutase/phosphoglucomutase [Alphaproteobacteria bacterium]